MIWSLTGLAGLLWLASKESSPILLDLRMSLALKQQLLAALQLELPSEKLEAIAQRLAGAHYHEAAGIFAQRARRQARSGPEPRANPKPSAAEVRTASAAERGPDAAAELSELLRRIRAVSAANAEASPPVPEAAWQEAFTPEPEFDDEDGLLENDDSALDALSPAREHTPIASEGAVAHDFEELQ